MTDHARPPEGVETWTLGRPKRDDAPTGPWQLLHRYQVERLAQGGQPWQIIEVVRLSALLAEREARKRAEGQRDDVRSRLPSVARDVHLRLERAEAERDAAVARAEQAEAALGELVRLKDGPRDDAYVTAKITAWDRARAILEAGAR